MLSHRINNIVLDVIARREIIYFILSGLVVGMIIVKLPYLAIFLIVGILFAMVFVNRPLGVLAMMILVLPFSKTPWLKVPVMMKGTEPIYLIATLVFIIALLNLKDSVKMPKYALMFILVILTVSAVAALRSIPNLDLLNLRNLEGGREALSPQAHILKIFVRPLFTFLPIIIVIKYVKNTGNLEFIIKVISLAILLFSIFILCIYFFIVPDKGLTDSTHQYYFDFLGSQRNSLADYFMIGFPFFLARYYLKKNIFNTVCICLCLLAVGFLFTRTAYVTIILTSILYLIISKRAKFLPVLTIIAFGLSFVISSAILERAFTGFETGDRNIITTGRTDNQWAPLLNEYLNDPEKLLFGNGRYAIVSSKSVARGLTPDSMLHPHNMYIEQILDGGMVSFIVIISFFVFIMYKIFNSLKIIKSKTIREYQYAVFVSMTAFFIAGMTGRTLFPSGQNSYFWLVLGVGIAIIRMIQELKEDNAIQSSKVRERTFHHSSE